MGRRIFIALELPSDLKQKLARAISQWRWLSIRWLPPENWHLTLIPPAVLNYGELEKLLNVFGRTKLQAPFNILFSRILLAPPGRPARMIWLEGDSSRELAQLKAKLEKIWPHGNPTVKSKQPRTDTLHVTLARFQPGELAELESKMRVLGEAKFGFTCQAISVMESHLTREGARYETIAIVPLA